MCCCVAVCVDDLCLNLMLGYVLDGHVKVVFFCFAAFVDDLVSEFDVRL